MKGFPAIYLSASLALGRRQASSVSLKVWPQVAHPFALAHRGAFLNDPPRPAEIATMPWFLPHTNTHTHPSYMASLHSEMYQNVFA